MLTLPDVNCFIEHLQSRGVVHQILDISVIEGGEMREEEIEEVDTAGGRRRWQEIEKNGILR